MILPYFIPTTSSKQKWPRIGRPLGQPWINKDGTSPNMDMHVYIILMVENHERFRRCITARGGGVKMRPLVDPPPNSCPVSDQDISLLFLWKVHYSEVTMQTWMEPLWLSSMITVGIRIQTLREALLKFLCLYHRYIWNVASKSISPEAIRSLCDSIDNPRSALPSKSTLLQSFHDTQGDKLSIHSSEATVCANHSFMI